MSTADNRTCLGCQYTSYTANQCFSTGLCLKAVEQLQARIKELESGIRACRDSNDSGEQYNSPTADSAQALSNLFDLVKGGEEDGIPCT